MAYFITIDGGTTNTRISLCEDFTPIDTVKLSLGARAGIDGSGELKAKIKEAIRTLLEKNSIAEEAVERILAAGMISSEFGLYALPHAMLPISISDLSGESFEVALPEISSIPFIFMRGIKKLGDTLEDSDLIRGEETELAGIFDSKLGDAIYVLPGSHTKVMSVKGSGEIADFSTLLSGEMLYALSESTILKDALDLSQSELDEEFLLFGYTYAREHGINNALFKVRVQKNVFNRTPCEIYSFFVGVVLCDEVREILKYDGKNVVIGGKRQMRLALAKILVSVSDKTVTVLSDEEVDTSLIRGMLKLYKGK